MAVSTQFSKEKLAILTHIDTVKMLFYLFVKWCERHQVVLTLVLFMGILLPGKKEWMGKFAFGEDLSLVSNDTRQKVSF